MSLLPRPENRPALRAPVFKKIAKSVRRSLVFWDTLPEIPTVGEFVPGYEASIWFGVGAPKATPAEIVEKLNKEINVSLAEPKISARLADMGGALLSGSPADLGKLIAEETEKWGKVVKFTGIKAD
jgi:tripartite-type tricarboxylate transporter receptor subunit TctC